MELINAEVMSVDVKLKWAPACTSGGNVNLVLAVAADFQFVKASNAGCLFHKHWKADYKHLGKVLTVRS